MTAPDMRDARAGAVVTFRCGGEATVKTARVVERGDGINLWFEEFDWAEGYLMNGRVNERETHGLDIIHIEPPPLSIEDQLAAANAAIRERDERLASIHLILSGRHRFHANDQRVEISLKLLWGAIDRAIALAEKRTAVFHNHNLATAMKGGNRPEKLLREIEERALAEKRTEAGHGPNS